MNFILVAIKDRSVEAFITFQPARAEGEAIRNFQDAINNPQSGPMHKHPDDYDLYLLGQVDDHTGALTPEPTPRKLADGKQLAIQGE